MPTLEITQELLDKLNSGESITIEPPKKEVELEEIREWYEEDDIKPLLCIFSDDPIPEVIKDLRGYLVQFFDRYDKNSGYFYGKDYRWNYCRPLTKEQAAEFGL